MDTDNKDQNLLNVDTNTSSANMSSADVSVLEVSTNQDDTLNYQTADEENSSKYFSMIEGDSTLEGSCSVDVTLDSKSDLNSPSIVESESDSKPSQVLNSLANLTIESVNKLHIHERIDAANILSGGVDIFDDNENSLDEHELVIDDDAHPSEKSNDYMENSAEVSEDMRYKGVHPETEGEEKETETNFNKHFELFKKNGDEEIISDDPVKSEAVVITKEGCDEKVEAEAPKKEVAEEVQEAEARTDNYSALLQSNLPEGSSEVTLVIDDKNTEAIDIGEGVFIYKRDDGELTALQITMNEEGVTNFKCLHVGKNEDGNLEVYEEQVNQVPVTNEELESMKAKEFSIADEAVDNQITVELQPKDISIVSEAVDIQITGELQPKDISIVNETVNIKNTEEVQLKDISIISEAVDVQITGELLPKDTSIVSEAVDIQITGELQLKNISIVSETVNIQNTEEVQPKDISIVNETVDILQNTEVQLKDISIINKTVDIQSTEEVQLEDIFVVNATVNIQSTEEVHLKDISTVNETIVDIKGMGEVPLKNKEFSAVNETSNIQNTKVGLKDISSDNDSVDIRSTGKVQLEDISTVNEIADIPSTEEVQLKEISQDKPEVSENGGTPQFVAENANSECEDETEEAEDIIVDLASPSGVCDIILDKSNVYYDTASVDEIAEEDVVENATIPSIFIKTTNENLNSSAEIKTKLEPYPEVQLTKNEHVNASGSTCDVSLDPVAIEEIILTVDTKEKLDHPKHPSISEPAERIDLSSLQGEKVAPEDDLEAKIDVQVSDNYIESESVISQVSSPANITLSDVKIDLENLPTQLISDSTENSDKLSIVECSTETNISMTLSEIIEVNNIDGVDSSSFNATSPSPPKFSVLPKVESPQNDEVVAAQVVEGSDELNLKQDVVPEEVITLGASIADVVMGPEEWLESEESEITLNDVEDLNALTNQKIPENKPVEVMEIDDESSEPNIIELSDEDSADTQIVPCLDTVESATVKDFTIVLLDSHQVDILDEGSSEMAASSTETGNKLIDFVTSNIPPITSESCELGDIVSTDNITLSYIENQNTEIETSPVSPNEIPVLQISDTSDSDDTIEVSLGDKPIIQSTIPPDNLISVSTEEEPEKNQESSKKIECSNPMYLSSKSVLKNSFLDSSPLKTLQSQSSVESEDDPEDDDYVEGEPVTGDSGVEWIAANSAVSETLNVNTASVKTTSSGDTLGKPMGSADLNFGESSCISEPPKTNDTFDGLKPNDLDKGLAAPHIENQEISDNNNDISADGLPDKKVIDVKTIQSVEKNVVSEVDFDKFVRRNSIPLLEVCNSIEFEDVTQTVKKMPVLEECEIVEISSLPVKEMLLPTLSNNGVKVISSVTTQPSQKEVVVNKAISPREVSAYKPTLPQLYRSPVTEKSNYSKNLSPPPMQSAHKQIIPNKSKLLQRSDVKILTQYTESPSRPFTNVSKLRTYSPSHKLNSNLKPVSIQNRSQQNVFKEVDKMRAVQAISSPRPYQFLVQAKPTIVANISLVGNTIMDHKDKSSGANPHSIMDHKNKSPCANRDSIMDYNKDKSSSANWNTITDLKNKSPGTNRNIILDHKIKSPEANRSTITDHKDKSPCANRNTITDHKDKSPVANIEKTSVTNIISVNIPVDTETISSAEDSPNSEQKPQAKCRQPRKQVFTPVTRSDMEIIFPNLYSNAEEYKKESEAKALKMTYKLKERDIRFKQLSKKDPTKNSLEKSPKSSSPNSTLSPGSKPVTIDIAISPERDSKVQQTPDILKSDSPDQLEIMNLDNNLSNSPISSSAKRKRGRPKKNQTISTDVLESDDNSPLKKHLSNETSDISVKAVPVELAESPVNKVEKAKESSVIEAIQTKITHVKEVTDPKEILVKEVINTKGTLVQEVTEANVTSVKDVSKAKESSAKEVSKVNEAPVKEVSIAKETFVEDIMNVKETPVKGMTNVTELLVRDVAKTKETPVEEAIKTKEYPAKDVTQTKQTFEKGATMSKETSAREGIKQKESPFQEATKSEDSPRTNPISPFGKINDNIKCPMCFKTFRTENVLLKHVKHCNGIIDVEIIKSPRKRKIIIETLKDDLSCNTPEKKAAEPESQDYDITLKNTATKNPKPEITSDTSAKIQTKPNPCLSDNLPKKRGRKPKVVVLDDEIPENKPTKPDDVLDLQTDPKIPVNCENIPEKKGLQFLSESPKIKSIDPANEASEVLHLKEIVETSQIVKKTPEVKKLPEKAIISFNQQLKDHEELSNELTPEKKNVILDELGNDLVIIMKPVKTMPSKSLLETVTIEDSFSASPLNHKFENNVMDKSLEKVEPSLGTVKEKLESKIVLSAKHESGELNNPIEKAKNISDKAFNEKTVGGSKKLLEKPPTAMASPMSRLAKIMNTKPVVNSPIECEICGKTFRQLAHMVYHRTKHIVDESEPEPISSVEIPKATTPKKPVIEDQAENSVEPETMLKCEICQKGFRKLHHLVEHRELHANSESRSRRTSVASVKSEPESAGFRCDTCDKSFRKLHHLVEHRELHIAEALQSLPQPVEAKPIDDATCSGCGKSFRKRHHMVEHRDIHCSPSKKGKTDDSSNDNNIRLSVASSTSEDGNNCGICGKSYRKLHHMVEHRESHAEVREEKSTNLPEILNTKDIIHECSRCYMVFPNENSLNKHVTICSRKKLLNKSKSMQQEIMHLIDDVAALPNLPDTAQREEGVSDSNGTASKLEPVITHVPDIEQAVMTLNKSSDVSNQNIPAKNQDVEVSVSPKPATFIEIVSVPTINERAPPNRPGRRSLFSNDIPRTQVSKRKSLTIDAVSSKSHVATSVPTNLNTGVQRSLRKSLVARSQETSKIEEPEKRLYTSRNLRKSTSSVDTVTSRASSRRSINSTTSIDSKDPIRKTVSSKDSTTSKLKIPLRKSLPSDFPSNTSSIKAKSLAPAKTTTKVAVRKSSIQSKDEEPNVKYMIKEPKEVKEPQPKYKINPEFNKPNRRLSQPLAPKNVTKTIIKPRKRVIESVLSGLKLPSAKMLKTIIEESDIRYSFPKSPKLKSMDQSATELSASISSSSSKKPVPAKVSSQLPKMNENTRKTKKVISSVLMSQKRKSLGGRNSIEGRKLPGLAKKAPAALQLRCCQQVFTSQASLSVHRKTHKAVRQAHRCDCGKSFDTEGLLKRHIHTEHTPPKSFKCTDCGASVRTAAQFAKHKKDHETHPPKVNDSKKVIKTTTKLQTESAPKIRDTKKVPAKVEEVGVKKGVKRKIAHGGVPLSDKMRKAMAGVKF